MNLSPAELESCKAVTEMEPDAIREAVEGLGTDEVLAFRTDLDRRDCIVMERALGRGWRIMFRQGDGLIWTRSRKSALAVRITERPLSYYVRMIEDGRPFAFLRYGDMLACPADTLYPGYGFQGFTPELKADMRQTLLERHEDPHYIMALAPVYHFERLGLWGHVAHFLHDSRLDDIEWADTEVFNRAMRAGELWPFIRALRNVNTLVVGPAKLAALAENVLPGVAFLAIPDRECHAQMDEMVEAILAQRPRPAVVTISAGPAAVVLIHRLFPVIGKRSTMISVGSLWGPFIGILEHGGQNCLTPDVMRRNLGVGADG